MNTNTKKQKIFFIYPPSSQISSEEQIQYNNEAVCLLPPQDMMSLSTIAKKRGYETRFSDYGLKNQTVYDFLRDLRVFKPDFIVLDVSLSKFREDLSILTQAKELLDDTVVIVKGAAFNSNSYSIMQKYPEIDISLRGEIESAFDEIIQYHDLKEIEGITYQINNKITQTPDRPQEDNINNLPFLDRDLIDNNIYICPLTKEAQTVITVSKGCPKDCFACCTTSLNGNTVRYKDSQLIVEEIKECIEKYNISNFYFKTDIFNYNNDWVQELCSQIIENNLKINFSTNTRVEFLNFDIINLMKKAGCNLITLNIKSASRKILDRIDKKVSLDDIKQTIKLLNDAKIKIHTTYIIGFPWETKETINETYKFAKELNTQFASFETTSAPIGTKYYDFIIKNRLDELNHENPYIFQNPKSFNLSRQKICEYQRKLNKNYYLRPNYILKMTLENESIAKFKSYYDTFSKLN